MSYCQTGEDAHLWINGSEHWKFPGPITVEIQQEQGEIFYPNLWYHEWEYLCYRCVNPFLGWQSTSLKIMTFYTENAIVGSGLIRGYQYNGEPGGLYAPDGSQTYTWLAAAADRNRRFRSVTSRTCADEKSGTRTPPERTRILKSEKVNHDEEPTGKATYKLVVNGVQIWSGDSEPTYSVKCGDKCPPGMKWDDRCGKCVCENMGALKWHMGNAVDIARLI